LWFKWVKLRKDGSLASASVIERTMIERMSHDRSQTMSAREVRIALADPMLHHFNTCVVGFQSNYLRLIAHYAIEHSAVECNTTQSNVHGFAVKRST
jgi:citrate lyase synthetase